MTTTSPKTTGGARVRVQRFGTFLSGMIMPNIAAFIAWGLITAFFIPTGWTPNESLATLVDPMIKYLLPLLIANQGGRMIYGVRGGVVGTIATMGVIVGAEIPMFLGAMIVGPLAAWIMKQVDKLWAGKIRAGFEMLVDNFSAGILGVILALGAFFGVAPLVSAISGALSAGVDWLVAAGLLPLASIFIEPGKVLFLNNAINQGILTPLGIQQATDSGKSILFLLEANPGPGLGLLLAYTFFGVGVARASAPGAIIIQFFGGIHEIYFPYVLMKPILVLSTIAGGATGIAINVAFNSGLRAPASPGSIFAIYLQTASDSYLGVTLSVIGAAAVSFAIAAVILRASRKRDLEALESGDDQLASAVAANAANKGGDSKVGALLNQSGGTAAATSTVEGTTATRAPIQSIVFACDAGMGSSAMGATVMRNKLKKAGIEGVTVVNESIANLSGNADLVITQRELTPRATEKSPNSLHYSVDNFMGSPKYDEVVALLEAQKAAK
ncbi:PTS mannitol transporter subunit IICB [Conyzicola sp.]|uniref:PTS mannitol transporter subunit IICB n=1 Tax=Conyzicola sp. TaxID=1969404 RepID=UPI003988AC2C